MRCTRAVWENSVTVPQEEMMNRVRISPATVLATTALFFALGGSAFAVQQAVKPQGRCSVGTARGIVTVVGDPSKGIANFPSEFTTSKQLVPRQYACGGAPQVRRSNTGQFEVRFPGNTASSGVVSTPGGMATVEYVNGLFRVTIYKPGQQSPPFDYPFTLVAF